ncbi:MAG: hypothetical protein GY782_01400 [Gammaproteobacteria bacterium]|nr:hypothetical protein [Gammaproteobacteria bacterium]
MKIRKYFTIVGVPFLMLFIIFVSILMRHPLAAYGQHGMSGRYSNVFVTHDYEEVSSTTGVEVITPALIDTTFPNATHRAYIAVSGQGIRFTCDGTTPTTSLGNPVAVDSWVQIVGLKDIQNFQFINDDGSGTAVCHINLQYEEEMKE